MSHIALARKWRPQRFEDVIGQRGVVETLKNAIATGRLAQSFIFAGPARRRQDDDGADSGAGAELRERADARAVRHVRCLHRDRRRPRRGRARNRRRDLHRRRRRSRGDRRAARDRADARPLQDLHHRRSPPAVEERLRRAPQVDRRAAAVREVHDGDDRSALGARHDPVAIAGLRAEDAAVRPRFAISFAGSPPASA